MISSDSSPRCTACGISRGPTTRPTWTGRSTRTAAGSNWWNIGVKSWEVIPAISRPRADLEVYICGEAYSDGQGWVEGALQTAEIVLQKHFGLPAPAWVGHPERAPCAPPLTIGE